EGWLSSVEMEVRHGLGEEIAAPDADGIAFEGLDSPDQLGGIRRGIDQPAEVFALEEPHIAILELAGTAGALIEAGDKTHGVEAIKRDFAGDCPALLFCELPARRLGIDSEVVTELPVGRSWGRRQVLHFGKNQILTAHLCGLSNGAGYGGRGKQQGKGWGKDGLHGFPPERRQLAAGTYRGC